MAFDLPKVLKALLLSSSQPLAVKDIQAAFTRFHAESAPFSLTAEGDTPPEGAASPKPSAEAGGVTETPASVEDDSGEAAAAEAAADPDLYHEVPSLVTAAQIREAMDVIAAGLKASDEGLTLIEGANGYRLVTHPRFGRWVRILRQEPPPAKLSQSSLETLAVVAYRQPVTRLEIETIRGVSAEAGVTKLLERELIAVTGRADLPGRPLQYATTDHFLELVGIKSLDELPASDVLTTRQIDEWLKNAASPHKPGDADMGLEQEQQQQEQLPLEGSATPAAPPEAKAGEA